MNSILFPGGFSAWRAVSLGAITFGLIVVVWHVVRWKAKSPKGAFKNRQALENLLIPFFPLWIYGNLMILSANGILGWLAGASLWTGDMAGRKVLLYGAGADSPAMTRASGLVLTNQGLAVLVLITTGIVAYGVHKKSLRRWDLILPVMAGTCMGLSQGLCGMIGRTVGPGADTLGALLFSWV
jgi:hypothetical protein